MIGYRRTACLREWARQKRGFAVPEVAVVAGNVYIYVSLHKANSLLILIIDLCTRGSSEEWLFVVFVRLVVCNNNYYDEYGDFGLQCLVIRRELCLPSVSPEHGDDMFLGTVELSWNYTALQPIEPHSSTRIMFWKCFWSIWQRSRQFGNKRQYYYYNTRSLFANSMQARVIRL
jgi:hypothetical protein